MSVKLLLQIVLALLFGLLAGFVHYRTSQVKQARYAFASQDLRVGETLQAGKGGNLKLVSIPVPIGGAPLEKTFIDESRLPLIEGMVINRDIPSGTPILRSDFEVQSKLAPRPGMVALNVPITGIKFEPSFLRVGEEVHFVVESVSESTSEAGFALLGPFRLLAVEGGTTAGQASGAKAPQTICIEVATSLDANSTRLLSEIRSQGIVALAFGAEAKAGAGNGSN